jgi:hypothetical protein
VKKDEEGGKRGEFVDIHDIGRLDPEDYGYRYEQ